MCIPRFTWLDKTRKLSQKSRRRIPEGQQQNKYKKAPSDDIHMEETRECTINRFPRMRKKI